MLYSQNFVYDIDARRCVGPTLQHLRAVISSPFRSNVWSIRKHKQKLKCLRSMQDVCTGRPTCDEKVE